MAVIKFTPDRKPRRDDPNQGMTVWEVLLLLIDWLTQNYVQQFKSGQATVAQTNTTLVVTHGLGVASYRVAIVPVQDPGGRWWISNKTGSQFQINLQTAAPAGGISFDWFVKGD